MLGATHPRLNESGQSSCLPAHRAGFRFLKIFEEFDFSFQSSLRPTLLGSVLSPDFVTEGRAVAYRHIQSGFDVVFTTAAKLIGELSTAAREGRFSETLSRYTHPAVLVVDELGYLAYGDNAANMLFHVVNDRYLSRRSMIFTTNKKLTQWGRVLHDTDLAAAIVDRLLERGRLLLLDGPSMRTRHLALEPESTTMEAAQPDIISGNHRPDFPESTSLTLASACENDKPTSRRSSRR